MFHKDDIESFGGNLYSQKDGATFHTCGSSFTIIEKLFNKKYLKWPSNSPDPSPIETIWSIVKLKLISKKNKNLEELRDNIVDIWSKISFELCYNVWKSFDDKNRLCLEIEGKRVNKEQIKTTSFNESKDYEWDTIKRAKKYKIVLW